MQTNNSYYPITRVAGVSVREIAHYIDVSGQYTGRDFGLGHVTPK